MARNLTTVSLTTLSRYLVPAGPARVVWVWVQDHDTRSQTRTKGGYGFRRGQVRLWPLTGGIPVRIPTEAEQQGVVRLPA
jgi:hypothetical protein